MRCRRLVACCSLIASCALAALAPTRASAQRWVEQARDRHPGIGFSVATDGAVMLSAGQTAPTDGDYYVFDLATRTLVRSETYTQGGGFGLSMAYAGDTVAISAPNAAEPVVWVTSISGRGRIVPVWSPGRGDQFGLGLALFDASHAIVGAPRTANVYWVDLTGTTPVTRLAIGGLDLPMGPGMGGSLAFEGGLLAIGSSEGVHPVDVWRVASDGTMSIRVQVPNSRGVSLFGSALALDGDLLAIGSPGEDAVEVWDVSTSPRAWCSASCDPGAGSASTSRSPTGTSSRSD
jgi:hypothetical protein